MERKSSGERSTADGVVRVRAFFCHATSCRAVWDWRNPANKSDSTFAAAADEAEGAVELLRAPQFAVMILGERLKVVIDGHLRLVTRDRSPDGAPVGGGIDPGRDSPIGPGRGLPLDAVHGGGQLLSAD